jgi:nickel/cobalt transporter (NicO) family protein
MEVHGLESLLATLGGILNTWQRDVSRALAAYLSQAAGFDSAAWAAAAFAFALGMLHAATPGHGKLVVFSYFIGREARPGAGVVMALKIAATHIAVAIVLFMAADISQTVFFGRAAGPALAVQAASYFAITVLGGVLLYRSLRPTPLERAVETHRSGALPFVVGMLPCPLTLLILSYAVANASLAAGLVLVAIMGLGITVTISVVALLAMIMHRTMLGAINAERLKSAISALEIASGGIIMIVGAFLFVRTVV